MHPAQHRPPAHRPTLPATWWLRQPGYRRYMARELTSIAVAGLASLMTIGLLRLAQGPAAWDGFRAALATPLGIGLLALLTLALGYHSLSWFALAPSTMPVRIGSRRLPSAWIAAGHYLVWIALSVAILRLAGL